MRQYSLNLNDNPICEVEIERPEWLEIEPNINLDWLQNFVRNSISISLHDQAAVVTA